jgi:hypothetical protein
MEERVTNPSDVTGQTRLKKSSTGNAMIRQDRRVNAENDDGQPQVDGEHKAGERPNGFPPVGGHGITQQGGGADGGEPNDPPQHHLHDFQQGFGEPQERVGGLTRLERSNADGHGDHNELQRIEIQGDGTILQLGAQPQNIAGNNGVQEPEPRPGGGRLLGGAGIHTGAHARLDEDSENNSRGHGEECGDSKPYEGVRGQPSGIGDLPQVSDRRHHGGEYQRRYHHLE